MKRKLVFTAALAMTVALLSVGGNAGEAGKTRVVKMGYGDPAGKYSHYSYFLDYFNEELDKLTGGTIRFEGYPDLQLGSEPDMLNAMSEGTLDSACLSVDTYSAQIPPMQLFVLPYIFNYPEQFEVLTDNAEFMKNFSENLEKNWGIVFLGSGINGGARNIITTKDINSLADMKDLVLRISTSPVLQATYEALGATPTVIAFSEVYTAFSTGVVDAVEVPIETFVFKGIYDSGKSVAITNAETCIGWPMMSKACWDSFSQAEQAILKKACAAAVARQREFLAVSEQACIDFMAEKANIYVTKPDLRPFKEATRSVHKKFAGEIGPGLLKEAYDLLDADNAKRGYPLWSEIWK